MNPAADISIPDLQSLLQSHDIRFVRVLWCDHANLIRAKAIHSDHGAGLAAGVALTPAQQALPVMFDAVAPDSGLEPVGRVRLIPDWSSLTMLPYAAGHAGVLADMRLGSEAWEHCPRDFLRRQALRLEARGLGVHAAFENEFTLLRRGENGTPLPLDDTVYAATGAMNIAAEVVNDIADALVAQGLEVEGYHPESGPGQQEMTIRPAGPLAAADRQIVFRETVRGIAGRHGLIASFLPKLFAERAGNGCHLNLSLQRGGIAATGDPDRADALSPETRAFMAGILAHLPGLAAVTLASSNSYRRIRPHSWAGAYRCWGHENREAALRVARAPDSERPDRIELKSIDASANPYLALGCVLAAGIDGLEREMALPAETTVDPGTLTAAERERRGIDGLPADLATALDALGEDPVLLAALGEARARAYRAVKRMEYAALADSDLAGEIALLVERY